jgi:hypothetical protein
MNYSKLRSHLAGLSVMMAAAVADSASALSFDGFKYSLELGYGKMENTLKKLHEGSLTAKHSFQLNMLMQTSDFFEGGLAFRQSRYEDVVNAETKQTSSLDGEIVLRLKTPYLEFGDFSMQLFGAAAYMLAGSQRLLYANSPEMTAATSAEARGEDESFWATKSGYRYGGGLIFEYAKTYGLTAEYTSCEESWRAEVVKTKSEESKKPIKDSTVTGSAFLIGLRISH